MLKRGVQRVLDRRYPRRTELAELCRRLEELDRRVATLEHAGPGRGEEAPDHAAELALLRHQVGELVVRLRPTQ